MTGPFAMGRFHCVGPVLPLGITEHGPCDAVVKVLPGADPINRLHLPVAAVAPFDGVGGRGEPFVVEGGQRLLRVGSTKLVQDLAELLETANAPAPFGAFRSGGIRSATTIKLVFD